MAGGRRVQVEQQNLLRVIWRRGDSIREMDARWAKRCLGSAVPASVGWDPSGSAAAQGQSSDRTLEQPDRVKSSIVEDFAFSARMRH